MYRSTEREREDGAVETCCASSSSSWVQLQQRRSAGAQRAHIHRTNPLINATRLKNPATTHNYPALHSVCEVSLINVYIFNVSESKPAIINLLLEFSQGEIEHVHTRSCVRARAAIMRHSHWRRAPAAISDSSVSSYSFERPCLFFAILIFIASPLIFLPSVRIPVAVWNSCSRM